MRLINNTHWRTDHLRAIISHVVMDELDSAKRARLIVTINYTGRNHGFSTGCARRGGSRMTVRLAKQLPFVSRTDLAKVIAHEAAHLRGMTHRTMTPLYHAPYHRRTEVQRLHFAWAETMPLEVKPKKVKKVENIQEKRYGNVLSLQKKWATKLKLAQTKLRKLRAKQRYYERALAASKTGKM